MASDSATLSWRVWALEDLLPGVYTQLGQIQGTVFGLGPGISLTPVVSAASDSAALATGLNYGDVYLNTGLNPIRLRAISATTSGATAYYGPGSLTPGAILDITAGAAGDITNLGAAVGGSIASASPSIATTGVRIVSKVVAAQTVGIEIWNLSGSTVTIGSVAFNSVLLTTAGTGSAVYKLTSISTLAVGSNILDSTVLSMGTIGVAGAAVGSTVLVNTNPPLPTGIAAFAYV